MAFLKAKTSLDSGESIAKVYCLTSSGNIIEASGDMLGTILSSGGVNLTEQIQSLQKSVNQLSELYGFGVEGYVRVAGTSDPNLGFRAYLNELGDSSVFDCIQPCLIEAGTGKLLHVLNNLDFCMDVKGHERAIDGSEGEVFITNTVDLYIINGHVSVSGVVYDVFLRSRGAFSWQGHAAERIAPYGLSPDNVVAHADEDGVTRMHSVYNESFNGSYTPMNALIVGKVVYDGVGNDISESYDENGAIFGGAGGLHTTNMSLTAGEQYAMNLNADKTKTVPFFNEHSRATEIMIGNIIAEGGTFDAHKNTLMGSGFCCNDQANIAARWNESDDVACNGVRYVGSDDTVKYSIINNNKFGGNSYIFQFLNDYRSPWKIMERQRVMAYAIKNSISELTWFAFEGNKYKWRHVDGFAGPDKGVMTCVVWKMFSTQAGADCVDPVTNESITGKRIDFLFCGAIYRGWSTDVSPSRWISGLVFTEDETGLYKAYYQKDQAKMIVTTAAENIPLASAIGFESVYENIGEIQGKTEGYRKDYNDKCLFLAKDTASAKGAYLHTYLGAYNWFTGPLASASCRSVRGFRRGRGANNSGLSPFAMGGLNSPSYSNSFIGFGTCVQVAKEGAIA